MQLPWVIPFEPVSTDAIPQGDQWIGQVKWDGVRMLIYHDGTETRLVNRKQNERTMQYPELTNTDTYTRASSIILDGEIIAMHDGKPSFHEVMRRDAVRKESAVRSALREVPITYMVFDILYLNGKWLTSLELHERQSCLEASVIQGEHVRLVDNHPDPAVLFEVVKQHGLEGIVIKNLESTYVLDGKDKRWQKKKIYRDLIAVVGGVTFRAGIVNALLLGLYDQQGQLWYIGHAGTGKLKRTDWVTVTETAHQLAAAERPFCNMPERSKGASWIRPQLAVKVQYAEWTPHGTLRQPSIQSFVRVDVQSCTFQASL